MPANVLPTGRYEFASSLKVDTAAGVVAPAAGVVGGTFSCCTLSSGALVIPTYPAGAPSFVATFDAAKGVGCPAAVPDKTEAPPANTQTVELSQTITFSDGAAGGNRYTGSVSLGGQNFAFTVESGIVVYAMSPANAQPVVCDGSTTLAASTLPHPPPPPAAGANPKADPAIAAGNAITPGGVGNAQTGAITFLAISVAVVLAGTCAHLRHKRRRHAAGAAKSVKVTGTHRPPDEEKPALPPGWLELQDPSSKHAYFVNEATGESKWTHPQARL